MLSIMSKDLPPSTRTEYSEKSIDHVFIKKHDDSHEDILSVAGGVCDLIEENVQKGKGVLLHCAMGMSRSATIMAAFGTSYPAFREAHIPARRLRETCSAFSSDATMGYKSA